MINPTLEQRKNRYSTILENIKVIIFSEESADAVDVASKENGISKKNTGEIASVAGLVLLGFLRISDVAQELQERTGLDVNICKKISASLENKIFNSIRADLEKIYAPADSGPVKLEEIKSGIPPKPISETTNQPVVPLPTRQAPPVPQFSRPSFIKDTQGAPLPEPKPLNDLIKPKITIRPHASNYFRQDSSRASPIGSSS